MAIDKADMGEGKLDLDTSGISRGDSEELNDYLARPISDFTPKNHKQLMEYSVGLDMRREFVEQQVVDSQKKIDRRIAEINEMWDELARVTGDVYGQKGLSQEDKNRKAAQISAAKREVRQESEDERIAVLKEMQVRLAGLQAVASIYENAENYVRVFDLGSPERARAATDVAGLPDTALKAAFIEAERNQNLPLAAALLARCEDMNMREKRNLGIDTRQLCLAVAGDARTKALAALEAARSAYDKAMQAHMAFTQDNEIRLERLRRAVEGDTSEGESPSLKRSPSLDAIKRGLGDRG